MKTYKMIIIGAGGRGVDYSVHLVNMRDQFEIVGVADPIKERRDNLKNMFNLTDDQLFENWEEILSKPKFADIAIIATQDNMHYEPALKAIDLGYDLLLEKPVSQTVQECIDIANAAEKKGVKVLVCHVLRYAPFFKKVKELIMNDVIGDVQSVIQVEAVGNLHQSHSYVRGDWYRDDIATPMLLAKSCHDIDIIQWLVDKNCKKVSSFGDLSYFTPDNAPEGAPKRCIDTECPARETCPYNVYKVYVNSDSWMRRSAARGFAKEFTPTDDEVVAGLRNSNFGSCVFHANNDVVDHQVVNMEFEGGVTVTFTMNAFNKGGRDIRIFGTAGELTADMDRGTIRIYSFETKETTEITMKAIAGTITSGHGGGDTGIMDDLVQYFNDEEPSNSVCSLRTSYMNHLISFAAEEARVENKIVNMKEYEKNI